MHSRGECRFLGLGSDVHSKSSILPGRTIPPSYTHTHPAALRVESPQTGDPFAVKLLNPEEFGIAAGFAREGC